MNSSLFTLVPVVALIALFGVLLAAMLLHRRSQRFGRAEQVTETLAVPLLGTIPHIGARKREEAASQAAMVVASFGALRSSVRAAHRARPFAVTVTSPGPREGKSLVAANLALSFAEAGARTLLIDGDLRGGELAQTMGTPESPGLAECLDGTATLSGALHPSSSHPNVTVMPSGARRAETSALLTTTRLAALMHDTVEAFDVVIVDAPALSVGVDAHALVAATSSMALVLRAGRTDRTRARSSLASVGALPVRVTGAILNGAPPAAIASGTGDRTP